MNHTTNRLRFLRLKDQGAISEFRERLKTDLKDNLITVKLFGSKATGHAQPDSDIDLFILVRRKTSKLEDHVIDTAFEVNLKYGVYISPRVVGQSVMRHPVWRLTPFLRSVQREGISV